MTCVTTNPGGGFDAYDLDPDNPLYPTSQKNGIYFNGYTALESYGDSPVVQYSYTNTVSFWYKIDTNATDIVIDGVIQDRPVLAVEDSVCFRTNMTVTLAYSATAATSVLQVRTHGINLAQIAGFDVNVPTHDSTWHHIAFYQKSWDNVLFESTYKVYVDGVAATGVTNVYDFVSDAEFAYQDYWAVAGGIKTEPQRFEGCLDHIYFTYDDLDLSIDNNIYKFINSSTSEPVSLGIHGEIPTGNYAYIYLTGPVSTFSNNRGSRSEPFVASDTLVSCSSVYPDDSVDPPIGE